MTDAAQTNTIFGNKTGRNRNFHWSEIIVDFTDVSFMAYKLPLEGRQTKAMRLNVNVHWWVYRFYFARWKYNFFPKWNWYFVISMCVLRMRYHTSFVMRILWKFKWISADKALVSEYLTSFQDTTRHLKPSDILFDTQLTASRVSSGCQVSLIEMSQSRSHLFACSAHRRLLTSSAKRPDEYNYMYPSTGS